MHPHSPVERAFVRAERGDKGRPFALTATRALIHLRKDGDQALSNFDAPLPHLLRLLKPCD